MTLRVAVLSDIHGNLPALDAVLSDVHRAGVDLIVVGGDVAAGPLPAETVHRVADLGARARFVRGNAEREVVAAWDEPEAAPEDEAGLAAWFAARRLSHAERDFLDRFEESVVVEVDGLGPVRFCHGSPRSDSEMITAVSPEERVAAMLDGVPERVIVCGHTHRQFDRRIRDWRVVNAGSVGMPYEGRAGAFWALLGPDVELRQTDYDLAAALPRLRAGGFDRTDEMLRESLLEPADPDWVAHYFERHAR